jgi:hypothetical protein
MKCPCKECICYPICRNRHLRESIKKCSLLDKYIEANSTRYKDPGMRLIKTSTLQQMNKVFKWGPYDYSV